MRPPVIGPWIASKVQRVLGQILNIRVVRPESIERVVASEKRSRELLDLAIEQRNQANASAARLRELLDEALREGSESRASKQLLTTVGLLSSMVTRLAAKNLSNTIRREGIAGRRVVVVVTTVTQFPHLFMLCSNAKLKGLYRFLIIAYVEVYKSGLLEFCKRSDIALVRDFEFICGNEEYQLRENVEDLLMAFPPGRPSGPVSVEDQQAVDMISRLLGEVRRQSVIARSCQRMLQYYGASLLLMFEDNAEHETGIWVAAARAQLIPSMIIPFTIVDQLEPAEAHHHDRLFWAEETIFSRYVQAFLPQWLYEYKGRTLCRRYAVSALAAETLGFSPPDPWVLNSSKADLIAVESVAMQQHYNRLGLPAAQLRVTGSLVDDNMHAGLMRRDEIRKELSIDPTRRLLLCGFPPNQLPGIFRDDCEFDKFQEIIDFWFAQIARLQDWTIIIKPHPATASRDIEYMRKSPFMVSDLDTSLLISICDLYNTSVSSTIRWALACGKPVFNFDVFKFCYKDFEAERAVVTVSTCKDFADQICRFSDEEGYLRNLTREAELAADKWGRLDGHSTDRIIEVFDELMG